MIERKALSLIVLMFCHLIFVIIIPTCSGQTYPSEGGSVIHVGFPKREHWTGVGLPAKPSPNKYHLIIQILYHGSSLMQKLSYRQKN